MANVRVSVVGGGPWGRALALAAQRAGSDVTLFSRRTEPLEGVPLSADFTRVGEGRLILLAVPSAQVRRVAAELAPHLDGSHFLVHGIRGLEAPDLLTVSSVLREETAVRRLGAIGGPVLVGELSSGAPSVMVIGSPFKEVLELLRESLTSPSLRLYATRDLTGLEWSSALTGCLSIAIGFALGTGVGPGLIAAFTTRAVLEASRIVVAAGGEQGTVLGLPGLGDLLASINQHDRPEVALGKAIASGKTLDEAKALSPHRIEALELLPVLRRWVDERKVRAPILPSIVDAVWGQRSREELLTELMTAPLVGE